jgi:ferrous iron transport protein B
MWEKAQQYLRKMGGVILVAVIIIWALEYFPGGARVSPAQRLQQSYIGKIGKLVEPAIEPLGFYWRMGVSLITGAAAKEVVVSTMGVLFGGNMPDKGKARADLSSRLQSATYDSGHLKGQKIFTPLSGFSFILFILVYMPCVAVIAAVRREAGQWKWALFLMLYTTVLAWSLSFAFYQLGSLLISI